MRVACCYLTLGLLIAAAAVTADAASVVAPTGVTLNASSQFFPVGGLINGSGLSGVPTLGNYGTITHAAAGAGNAWVTDDPAPGGGDYYTENAGANPVPQMTLTFDQVYSFTHFLSWGYHFGSLNANEARNFTFEFSNDGGATFPTMASIVRTHTAGGSDLKELGGVFSANVIRMTITDNFAGTGPAGGDRVGLGELRFFEGVTGFVELQINRDNGAITLSNGTASPINLAGLGLTSTAGGLNAANWLSISDNYDSGGSVSSDPWVEFSSTSFDLSEGTVGTGTLSTGQSINLGTGTWRRSPYEDVAVKYLDSNTGEVINVDVVYTGTSQTDPYEIGDLNFDGAIDALDWPTYRDGYRANLTGLSLVEAYGMGDLNGDGQNNSLDFSIFKNLYEANNPGMSFASLLNGPSVPEPSTFAVLALGVGACVAFRRRVLLAVLALAAVGVVSQEAHAVVIVPTVSSSANLDAFGGTGPAQLIDNSGLSGPVNAGDATSTALGVTHDFSAEFADSYVTNDNGADYFAGSPTQPLIVWDLTGGGNTTLGSILLWQYQNNGGDGTSIGNQVRTLDLKFNTDAEGNTTFAGPTTTITLQSMITLGGINSTQGFNLSGGMGRYVQMTFTDNFAGQPGITGGGDRVGLGELRFSDTFLPDLTLEVNTVTGKMKILGDPADAFDIELYEITTTTASNTLNPTGWSSLADQDYEGSGPPNNSGDGWEELGTPTSSFLGEAFLQGSSVIGAGSTIDLGTAYNPSVLGSGVDGNLAFAYQTVGGSIKNGRITYVTTVGGLQGDFNNDGIVNAADYTLWRDNNGAADESSINNNGDGGGVGPTDYSLWRANFGATASGSLTAGAQVPEPAAFGLLAVVGLMGVVVRSRRRLTALATMAVAWAVVGSSALAMVKIDRSYLLGDDALEGASQGALIGGNNFFPLAAGVTADTEGPSGAFLDLTQANGATYQNVGPGPVGLARPGAASGTFGARFDGSDDRLDGIPLNRPDELAQLVDLTDSVDDGVPLYPLNYTGITLRGLQTWVYPTASALGSTTSPTTYQSIVFDTIFSGGPAINAQGQWTQSNSFHASGASGVGRVPASVSVPAGDTWYHVMHHNYALGAANSPQIIGTDIRAFTSVLYVDGIAVSANNDNINTGGSAGFVGKLVVGASEIAGDGITPAYADHFNGVVDDLEMYVYGNNTALGGQNWGTFDLFADNDWIAQEILATVPGGVLTPGDVNKDGSVNGTGLGPASSDDISAFIAGWGSRKTLQGAHNSIAVGDWLTWDDGDLNHDGITDFADWYILRANHPTPGSLDLAALLNGGGTGVPEPASALLVLAVGSSLVWGGRKHLRLTNGTGA